MRASTPDLPAQAHDFDFLLGAWTVRHRRLKTRLRGDDRWETFGGRMRAQPILRGQGNFDENTLDLPGGPYQACTLRIFHEAASAWSIHWIDGRDARIDPPMTGGFVDGIGTFHGRSHVDRVPVLARFLWSDITGRSAKWTQAFSADEGATWETNWTMEFLRS